MIAPNPQTQRRIGETKTEGGRTYRLNENWRWERADPDEQAAHEELHGVDPEDHGHRHQLASAALGKMQNKDIAGVIRSLHESPEYKAGEAVTTSKVHPVLAKRIFDWLDTQTKGGQQVSYLNGKLPAIAKQLPDGKAVDFGGGKRGFTSAAGAFVMWPDGRVSYTNRTSLVADISQGTQGRGTKSIDDDEGDIIQTEDEDGDIIETEDEPIGDEPIEIKTVPTKAELSDEQRARNKLAEDAAIAQTNFSPEEFARRKFEGLTDEAKRQFEIAIQKKKAAKAAKEQKIKDLAAKAAKSLTQGRKQMDLFSRVNEALQNLGRSPVSAPIAPITPASPETPNENMVVNAAKALGVEIAPAIAPTAEPATVPGAAPNPIAETIAPPRKKRGRPPNPKIAAPIAEPAAEPAVTPIATTESQPKAGEYDELVGQAAPWRQYGQEYDRNIAAPANRLEDAINRGLDAPILKALANELKLRLDRKIAQQSQLAEPVATPRKRGRPPKPKVTVNAPKWTSSSPKWTAAVRSRASNLGMEPEEYDSIAADLFNTRQEREREREAAKEYARKITGLKASDIARFENQGLDHSSRHDKIKDLDVKGRQLAGMFQGLGFGRGYEDDTQDIDHGELIWNLIKEGKRKPVAKASSAFLDEVDQHIAKLSKQKPDEPDESEVDSTEFDIGKMKDESLSFAKSKRSRFKKIKPKRRYPVRLRR